MTGIDAASPVATAPLYFTRQSIDDLSLEPLTIDDPFVVVALGIYRGELRRAIHAMKFRNCRWIAVRFGRNLAPAVVATNPDWRPDIVTWAPTTSRRVRLRGHDQSAIIAGALARRMRVLRRIDNHMQTGASRAMRQRGPQFVVHRGAVRGRAVLLVDDVMTTGTTLARARTALLAAGASEVRCVVIARVKARVSPQVG
jgi:ComF family protein